MRVPAITLVTLFVTGAVSIASSQTSDADRAAASLDFDRARTLYRAAIEKDPDPRQRDRAAIRLANIEWRLDHDGEAAEKDLAHVADDSTLAASAAIERARIAFELREDFVAAATAAQRAIELSNNDVDRNRAMYWHARALIEPVARARRAGQCTDAAATLEGAKAEISTVVAKGGPLPAQARLLLDAALLSNDGPTALAAWRGYYGAAAQSSLLAQPAAALRDVLRNWGADAAVPQRRAAGIALADSRFFAEAALVLRDPCAKEPVAAADEKIAQIVAYERVTRAFADKVNEYYRQLALKRAGESDVKSIVGASALELWNEMQLKGSFSPAGLAKALDAIFGAYASVGETGGKTDVHFGHRVIDEKREVTQYGRTAALHFIALDGMISNGFWSWLGDGTSGDGGWANSDAVYQVRPLYSGAPYSAWVKYTDPAARAEEDREIADESRRDDERIKSDPNLMPRGTAMRLRRQYVEQVMRALDRRGVEGEARREAFVERMTTDTFESSIWAHEGRHAIDKKYRYASRGEDLEFRAKLSEVALAPAPREAIESIAFTGSANTPHGAANRRIGLLLTKWMRGHARQIAGIDQNKPMLMQVDKLSDDQLREAFRSMDPLAKTTP